MSDRSTTDTTTGQDDDPDDVAVTDVLLEATLTVRVDDDADLAPTLTVDVPDDDVRGLAMRLLPTLLARAAWQAAANVPTITTEHDNTNQEDTTP